MKVQSYVVVSVLAALTATACGKKVKNEGGLASAVSSAPSGSTDGGGSSGSSGSSSSSSSSSSGGDTSSSGGSSSSSSSSGGSSGSSGGSSGSSGTSSSSSSSGGSSGSSGSSGGGGPTGTIHCNVYNLQDYFRSAKFGTPKSPGCPIDDFLALANKDTRESELHACGMRTPNPADFAALTPVGTADFTEINVPLTGYTLGFPGYSSALLALMPREFYGMSCTGKLDVPRDGNYKFQIFSDDGSELYIDGDSKPVVSDNGVQGATEKTGAVNLTAGVHTFNLNWYQATRDYIALELKWVVPGTTDTPATAPIIPATAFVN